MDTDGGDLQVVATPGHCDDHIVLYDRKEKVLLAGDAFMGSYFATPNPDVDSHKWLVSLERLMELDIEILVEGHGHIHTLRADVPDFPGVVIRQDPKIAVAQKLDYLRWLREQIESGFQEQLPVRVIEASCFPGGKRTSSESCATDECIRLLSLGHFSRPELVRSFVRTNSDRFQPSTKYACREESKARIVPSDDTIGRRSPAFYAEQRGSRFSYPEVGASLGDVPARYNVDHNRILLGKGEVTWRRAVAAIRGKCSISLGCTCIGPSLRYRWEPRLRFRCIISGSIR